jgi:sodium/hydrogen exchanger-like protein 6/7
MSGALFSAGAIIVMLMLIIYMVVASNIEKHRPKFGHESGIVIIIGFILSFLARTFGHEEFNHMMTFDENFFFYFILPPIVFASGYNMKRKKFFENIKNILIFGLLSTII